MYCRIGTTIAIPIYEVLPYLVIMLQCIFTSAKCVVLVTNVMRVVGHIILSLPTLTGSERSSNKNIIPKGLTIYNFILSHNRSVSAVAECIYTNIYPLEKITFVNMGIYEIIFEFDPLILSGDF